MGARAYIYKSCGWWMVCIEDTLVTRLERCSSWEAAIQISLRLVEYLRRKDVIYLDLMRLAFGSGGATE